MYRQQRPKRTLLSTKRGFDLALDRLNKAAQLDQHVEGSQRHLGKCRKHQQDFKARGAEGLLPDDGGIRVSLAPVDLRAFDHYLGDAKEIRAERPTFVPHAPKGGY